VAGTSQASATAPSSYAAKILARKPVAYGRLGDSAGAAIRDESKPGHDGTYNGTPGFGEAGAIQRDPNTAIKLDGRSYVEIPSAPELSQPTSGKGLTVEAWMRPDLLRFAGETSDPHLHWLGKGEPDRYEWAFRFYSQDSTRPNRISAYLWNPAGELGSGAYFQDSIKPGEWIHIVACFDPGDARDPRAGVSIYKNGVLRGGPTGQPGALYKSYRITSAPGSAPVRLGTRLPVTGRLRGGCSAAFWNASRKRRGYRRWCCGKRSGSKIGRGVENRCVFSWARFLRRTPMPG
jgi:hypothetical protein